MFYLYYYGKEYKVHFSSIVWILAAELFQENPYPKFCGNTDSCKMSLLESKWILAGCHELLSLFKDLSSSNNSCLILRTCRTRMLLRNAHHTKCVLFINRLNTKRTNKDYKPTHSITIENVRVTHVK